MSSGGGAGDAGAAGGGAGGGSGGACNIGGLHGPLLVFIPAGSTEIGSESITEAQPVHTSNFDSFCIDQTEVTVDQYGECMNDPGNCTAPGLVDTTDYPGCNFGQPGTGPKAVNCVSYEQAATYCTWAGKRLLTEEEWEYAARGSSGRTFPWGEASPSTPELANWNGSAVGDAGFYPLGATPEGVLDMAGNVWEYTSSFICPRYDAPLADCSTTIHVTRGGSWASGDPTFLMSAFRNYESVVDARFGIRCGY
jgi:formylglycine-generating enzyme required for sulfatase activity